MNSWNIIQQLEADNSSLAKQAIIKANISNTEFVAGATMCLDPLVTFGVKQVPISQVDGSDLDWSAFEILANALMNRDLTGHAARDAIIGAMEMATIEQWNDWYRRILIKDLR